MEGNKRVDELMLPVLNAINRHVKDRDAKTDIYNRAYEALLISMDVNAALREQVANLKIILDGEHNTNSESCWCGPKVETMDNGNKVIIHNDITPEEARSMSDIMLAIATADSTAELLKSIRKIRKLSILEVSEKAGINRNTIGQIENGNAICQASITTLSKIAHALGCDLRIELVPFEKITKE